ncbi:endo-1,4-beta-mannosidase [Psychromicrobium silvestre]|uniref:Endo-1,4-beta-mannosidase n=1 Tax=Psychromicrobium silvestre TaxID=1645614 RepID=A0A7Y9LTH6_9MICC|nr:glycosyl hydrolase [Psychromicrobium silvestre]NYE95294.1 endo-1,4-beta-mannosidase [Psychromicrobium silvestre]
MKLSTGRPGRSSFENRVLVAQVDQDVQTLRFGVNYTPSAGWFHHWLDFDLTAVHRDFESIASLGADHLRVFPLWSIFQPNRSLVRGSALKDLGSLVDAAAEHGLDVSVDALQGHLSSFDFLPSWVTSWHRTNLFTDPTVRSGQLAYLQELAASLAAKPNVLGLSLGNEFSQFASAEHPERNPLSAEEAENWLTELLAALDLGYPGGQHCHAEYDSAFFDPRHPFTPAGTARHGAMSTVHSWVFNQTAQRYGGMSRESLRLAEYLVELVRAWSEDPVRPIWLQEIGAPSPHVAAQDAARFTTESLRNVLDCEGLWGVTWWCSHDVDRRLADFPELEYDLGLLRTDQSKKPQGQAFQDVAEAPQPVAAPRTTALVLDVGEEQTAPGRAQCAPGGAFFEAWMSLAKAGARPGIVLESQREATDYLSGRGIQQLVEPGDVREPSS